MDNRELTEQISQHTENDKRLSDALIDVGMEEMVGSHIIISQTKLKEQPKDRFSGIDMLISTPESIEEIRLRYEEVKGKLKVAVETIRQANAEALNLEKQLMSMEMGTVPADMNEQVPTAAQQETAEEQPMTEVPTAAPTDNSEEPQPAPSSLPQDDKRQEALERYMKGGDTETPPASQSDQRGGNAAKWIWSIGLTMALLATIAYFLYRTSQSIDAVGEVPIATETTAPIKKATPKKTPTVKELPNVTNETTVSKDTVVADKSQAELPKPQRPATYKIQKGETLFRISQRFYGTKDSVSAIIRLNALKNPDNVPADAVIKLP